MILGIGCKEIDLYLVNKQVSLLSLEEGDTLSVNNAELGWGVNGPATVYVLKEKAPSIDIDNKRKHIENGTHKLCCKCLGCIEVSDNFCNYCGSTNPK